MGDNRSATFHGVIGGVLAATAIVLFFLLVDVARGELLRTPRFLASVLAGQEAGEVGAGLLALYTVVHYAVFAVLGMATAWLLEKVHAPATMLLGLVFGFLLFDVIFYASVALTGEDVVRTLGWPSFLVGNLLGGVVLMFYLSRAGVARGRSWREALSEHRVLKEGVVSGVIGALVVAGWFFVVDLVLGQLLFTPAALGSGIFLGAASAEAVQITATSVLAYTALHFVGFIALGLVFAALVGQAERSPSVLIGIVLLFVTFETLLLGMIPIAAAWLLDAVAWWSIAVGNLLAAAAMAAYLWRAHPRLRSTADRADDEALEAQAGRDTAQV